MSALSNQPQPALRYGSRPLPVPRPLLRVRSDTVLAERVSAGDEAAFDVLYERHRPVVLAVAMGVLGTSQDAEDATQETFSALAVALREKPPTELRPWLIRVARNAAIDTTRRRRHRLLTLDGDLPDIPAAPANGGKAELAVVFDAIRELPESQRMALLMRELGGHSYAEIAEFLATDEEAVKGLIARARVGLRAFREATELSCASARSMVAAEPDGRRYDRTVRRHLRTCAPCRSYREALRDDARALRAALPLQAGGVATTGIAGGGSLAAAKSALLGYGLTQAATCAASVCAVGAVGGIVLIAPAHRFGFGSILPAGGHRPQSRRVTAPVAQATRTEGTRVAVRLEHSGSVAEIHADALSVPVKPHPLSRHHSSEHSTTVTFKPVANDLPRQANPASPSTNSTAPAAVPSQSSTAASSTAASSTPASSTAAGSTAADAAPAGSTTSSAAPSDVVAGSTTSATPPASTTPTTPTTPPASTTPTTPPVSTTPTTPTAPTTGTTSTPTATATTTATTPSTTVTTPTTSTTATPAPTGMF